MKSAERRWPRNMAEPSGSSPALTKGRCRGLRLTNSKLLWRSRRWGSSRPQLFLLCSQLYLFVSAQDATRMAQDLTAKTPHD